MILVSAQEDFVLNTLAAVPGLLGKLEYIAGLRTNTGGYSHWGLQQVHGETAAGKAIGRAHADIWIEVLRTPLPALFQEWQELQNKRAAEASTGYLQGLSGQMDQMIPEEMRGGSLRHFNSILSTLSALSRGQQGASQRVA